MSIGDNIKKARISAGLTQKELAKKMDVSPQMISLYEKGRRAPKVETIQRIADAIGCNVQQLFPAIEDFKSELHDRIKIFESELELCSDETERKKLQYKIDLLKNEDWGIMLSSQTDEIYVVSSYFIDILAPYIKLNINGQLEATKRVEELTYIPKYKKDPTE